MDLTTTPNKEIETTHRVITNSEQNAVDIIEEYREAAGTDYIIKKSSYEKKTKKGRGDDTDLEVWVVTVVEKKGDIWDPIEEPEE